MHKHLTWKDRLKIEKAVKEGLKPTKIADRLHVDNSTIYRELKRGTYTHLNSDLTTEERYSPEIAQQRYEENLRAKGADLKIADDHELAEYIEKKI
ncbi:MAG: helix-turn-helix domain-containing protein, partial [Eubacterium sp.]|nr:helix-turn-helix domain-containing protein [Eubacterium sp.]